MTRAESIEAAARKVCTALRQHLDHSQVLTMQNTINALIAYEAALATADCSTGSVSQMGIAIPGSSLTAGQSASPAEYDALCYALENASVRRSLMVEAAARIRSQAELLDATQAWGKAVAAQLDQEQDWRIAAEDERDALLALLREAPEPAIATQDDYADWHAKVQEGLK